MEKENLNAIFLALNSHPQWSLNIIIEYWVPNKSRMIPQINPLTVIEYERYVICKKEMRKNKIHRMFLKERKKW